jgi:hypothetical protein
MDSITIDRLLSEHSVTRKYFKGVFPADKVPKCRMFPCALVVNLVMIGWKYNQ